jgi:hypothetical protein
MPVFNNRRAGVQVNFEKDLLISRPSCSRDWRQANARDLLELALAYC